MQRRTIDLMVSGAGLMLAVVLIVFGVYFNDRYQFADNNVRDQLSEQRIFFTEKGQLSEEELQQPGVVKYAGQLVDDGEKARVYADEYIGLHLEEIADGKTYAELGGPQFALRDQVTKAQETNDPALPELQAQLDEITGQRDTLFKGETLRGVLLTTYGFWQFGQEAQLAMYVSFAASAILLALVGFGVVHAMRTRRNATP
ncbi:MAG: hypothetical protein WD598_07825 [Acidimicrobiia bacterium]